MTVFASPVVSVIVPVLNTRPYLDECLESLLAQTLSSLEIICIDNGSTDGSLERLREYALHHDNIRVIEHPIAGRQGGARNAGMKLARGTYIGFVDSDDFVAPDMFEKLRHAIECKSGDVAVCNFSLSYPGGESLSKVLQSSDFGGPSPFIINERPRLLRNLTMWNKLYSRQLIKEHDIRFPEGLYHEDQFFVIAAFLLAERIVGVPESLYFYRKQRPGSVNEHRGADNLHVFNVMDAVDTFLNQNKPGIEERRLIDEVKALKYMQLYQSTGDDFRKVFYRKMREEFKQLDLPAPGRILSLSEHREFQVVRRYGYAAHAAFVTARAFYGRLRTRVVAGRMAASGASKG